MLRVAGVALVLLVAQAPTFCASPPTFHRDVAPIVHENCVPCHRRGGSGPFALTGYDAVRRVGRQLVEVTGTRFMPPWRPAAGKHRLIGERRLSEAQIRTLAAWFEAGMPEGDAHDAPPLPPPPPDWARGTPDAVITLERAYELPAEGSDVIRNFVLASGTTRDRWVRAVEVRPGNPQVVHHAILKVDTTHYSRRLAERDTTPGFPGMEMGNAISPDGNIVVWAPGTSAATEGSEYAWPLPAGADLVLQLHMVPSGKPERIEPHIGLYFAAGPPLRRPVEMLLKNERLDIPPGEAAYVAEDRLVLPAAVHVLGLFPHAHYLGKSMEIWADLPGGGREPLLTIDDWDFNWQDFYRFVDPVGLPAGATLHMRYVYDNSAGNPQNPHRPPRRVVGGNRSVDEMATLAVQLLPDDEASRLELQAAQFFKLVEVEPENQAAHYNLGVIHARAGDLDAAERHYRSAIELDPSDHFAHYGLGSVYARSRRFEEAAREYRRAIELQPGFAEAHYFLGLVYRDLGRPEQARASFARALELDPGNERARKALGR